MKKKKVTRQKQSVSKLSAKGRAEKKSEEVQLTFRERTLKDAIIPLKHPKPIPGYKATLPGPPGWQVKIDPGP